MRVIAGEAKGQRILSQRNLGARPTTQRVRSSLFAMLESVGLEGKRVVDLYAGTGTLGIEALSRGAIWADFVEESPKRCALLRRSLSSLGFSDKSRVHQMKVERALTTLGKSYDIVLMDPPYTLGPVHHVLNGIGNLTKNGALIAAGHSKHHPLEKRYGGLELVRERQYGDTVCSIYQEGGEPW